MEKFKLVADIKNPIVECHQLNLPIEKDLDFQAIYGYSVVEGKHRYLHSRPVSDSTVKYFHDLFYYKVTPLLFSDPKIFHTWPVTPRTVLEQTEIAVNIFKDEVGWFQGPHEDPKVFFCSGVLHLQDCEQGTTFDESGTEPYTAPTKKGYGAFWLNSHHSKHHVPKVTKERSGYLIMVKWKCLQPFNFEGDNYGAGSTFEIDYDNFYK